MQNVIKRERVLVDKAPAGEVDVFAAEGACASHSPGLRLVRVAGRVHAIELTCRCGETSLVELEYDESQENATNNE